MQLYWRGPVVWCKIGGRRRSTGARNIHDARAVVEHWRSTGQIRGILAPPEKHANRVVYFYAIEAVGARRIKLGVTDGDPEVRLAGLQTGCPFPLSLRLAVPTRRRFEREAHRRLEHLRVMPNAEWFHFTIEVELFLESLSRRAAARERVSDLNARAARTAQNEANGHTKEPKN